MSDEARDPALTSLEAALVALKPVPDRIERDNLLFLAGRASVRRGWLWPGATACLAVLLAASLLWRPAPQVIEHVVRVPAPIELSPSPEFDVVTVHETPPREGFLNLRHLVLPDGVEALSTLATPPGRTAPSEPPYWIGIRSLSLSGDPQ